MFTHVTDSGVTYEIHVSREEARRRMAAIIGKLWPTYLELVSASGGEKQKTKYEARIGVGLHQHPRRRPQAQGGRS